MNLTYTLMRLDESINKYLVLEHLTLDELKMYVQFSIENTYMHIISIKAEDY